MALRGARNKAPFLPCLQVILAQEPGDAVFAATFSGLAQRGAEPRAAVSATALLEDRFDFFHQLLVLLPARALRLVLMGVEAAAGDFQRLGQFLDLILGF